MNDEKIKTKLTPVRYPGGKSNALKYLDSRLLKEFAEYREPFFGGGSVGLYLMQTHKDAHYWINDLFYPVYCFWKTIYTFPNDMIKKISDTKSSIDGDESIRVNNDGGKIPSERAKNGRVLHKWCREEIKKSIDKKNEMDTACWWYILNKTSYSGMAMIGSYAPLAWDQNFGDKCIGNLKNTYTLMKSIRNGIEITCGDYSKLLEKDGNDVFVFLDPPYEISHSLYGENGNMHRGFDHDTFAEKVKLCNHKWMITYNDDKRIVDLFTGYKQIPWELQYTMKAAKRTESGELKSEIGGDDILKRSKDTKSEKTGKKGKELLILSKNYDNVT